MTIGERLRETRIDKDMTQAEVAKILKTTQTYYAEYELDKRKFPIKHLITVCKLWSVSADYILGLPPGLDWPRK